MHFVLWGLHQLIPVAGFGEQIAFQCTSCFGVFINDERNQIVGAGKCFNALRALGSSSTI